MLGDEGGTTMGDADWPTGQSGFVIRRCFGLVLFDAALVLVRAAFLLKLSLQLFFFLFLFGDLFLTFFVGKITFGQWDILVGG